MAGWMLAISRDTGLTQALARLLHRGNAAVQLWAVEGAGQARRVVNARDGLPLAILIDEPFLCGESLGAVAREFVQYAPLILVARSEWQPQMASLVAGGKTDFVSRGDHFIPMAVALVERALRWEREVDAHLQIRGQPPSDGDGRETERDDNNFPAEALRTVETMIGILDPVLNKPSRLPATAARRLARLADLAFDLKQGLRLLAGYSDRESATTIGTQSRP